MVNFKMTTTPELDGVLEEIRRMTNRPDAGEVLRDAIEFYDLVIAHAKKGKKVFIGKKRETAGEVVLPHLKRAQTYRGLSIIQGGKT